MTPLEDGQEFTFQDVTVTAIRLPGHTAGSAGFVVSTADGPILFAGDALLPRYTPNVGGADVRVDQSLDTYLTTLDTISDREFVRAYPGHRDPVDNPTARATEIIMHHRERAKRVLTIVRDCGPVDAWTVSAHLFGDLEGIHILHGSGEAYAHLDHLTRHGVLDRTSDGYVARKDTDRADIDAVFV